MSGDRRAVGGEHGPAAVELLPRLKRGGCNLLVTGTVSDTTANRATQRLLGSADLDRKRVLVCTEEAPPSDDLLPGDVSVDDTDVCVVTYNAYRDESNPLASLASEISDTVVGFDSLPTPLVGGELRLAVTSLGPLVSEHDALATEQFLRSVTDSVTAARGMGHYRYGGPRTDLSSLPVDRLFDGFVDLRDRTCAEQRLSIPSLPSTDWVGL